MRVVRPGVLFIITLFVLTALERSPQGSMTQEELNRTFDAFYATPVIDETAILGVENTVFKKDIATFTLKTGNLYFVKSAEGVVSMAVFIGEGVSKIEPVRPMDRRTLAIASEEHLHKRIDGAVNVSFTEMLIVSFDGTLDKLRAGTTPARSPDVARASSLLVDRMKVLQNQEIGFDISLVERIAGLTEGPLYLDFNTTPHGWLGFFYGPEVQVEVLLAARDKIGMFDILRPLIRTHRMEDYGPSGEYVAIPVADQKDRIDTRKYRMDVTIPDLNHFLVEVDVTFAPLRDNLPVVNFDLVNNIAGVKSTDEAKPLHLLKVTDDKGDPLPFLHRKNRVIIIPKAPLERSREYTYHFSIDEETIIQISSVHYQVLNTYPWFPQHGYNGGQYEMDWTIKAKKPLRATGSGRIVEDKPDGQFNVTRLVLDQPVQFPSLIFGQYQKADDVYKTLEGKEVSLSTFSSPTATYTITDSDVVSALTDGRQRSPLSYELTVPTSKPKSVLQEAKDILKFCESLYGPYPFTSLQVAQMAPYQGYGQAPPAFVQLTGEAFMNPAAEVKVGEYLLDFSGYKLDFFHEFFSHEISHQWWGHALQWVSDEDQWLSESFAEYTAGLYIMQYLGMDRFQGKLKEWRDEARKADPHAPIAWANNLSGDNAGIWRIGLIYNKGPYVLHMLRMQVGHDNYFKAMKNAIAKYRGQQVTTDQVKREIEAVVGYKLDYFFEQWYRNTGIPVFDYKTSLHLADDGKWVANITTTQRDKANFKIVSMPVFFHFGKDKVVVKERPILKAEDLYQVKLPEKPERITLDDNKTLLADIISQDPAGH